MYETLNFVFPKRSATHNSSGDNGNGRFREGSSSTLELLTKKKAGERDEVGLHRAHVTAVAKSLRRQRLENRDMSFVSTALFFSSPPFHQDETAQFRGSVFPLLTMAHCSCPSLPGQRNVDSQLGLGPHGDGDPLH